MTNGLDYLGVIPDTVFYSLFLLAGLLIIFRRPLKKLSFRQKAIIFIIATLALRAFFFSTGGQNEFPTGEVYIADVPALEHPYEYPWQAPYGLLWYAITLAITHLFLPIVQLFNIPCPGDCAAEIHYLDGSPTRLIPYTLYDWNLGLAMMIGYTALSLPFYWFLRKSNLLVGFFIADNFFWSTTPVNVPILLLAVAGMFNWRLLPAPVLAKLPFGSNLFANPPGAVWTFALSSASTPGHWFPHIMYGLWWIAAIIRWLPWRHSWNFMPDSREQEILRGHRPC